MTTSNANDITFDDFSLLSNLIGRNEINFSSRNTDCDCIGYTSTSNDDEFDTDQIAQFVDKTN